MRALQKFVVWVVVLLPMFAMQESPVGADIELQSNIIDLGELSQEDEKQIVRLSYTNTGDVPLVVTEVRTSCSCTTVKHDRGKLLPGERAAITITMDPAKAPEGSFYRVLKVYSTASSGVKHITLKAEIKN
jgi:hypothetical protein